MWTPNELVAADTDVVNSMNVMLPLHSNYKSLNALGKDQVICEFEQSCWTIIRSKFVFHRWHRESHKSNEWKMQSNHCGMCHHRLWCQFRVKNKNILLRNRISFRAFKRSRFCCFFFIVGELIERDTWHEHHMPETRPLITLQTGSTRSIVQKGYSRFHFNL